MHMELRSTTYAAGGFGSRSTLSMIRMSLSGAEQKVSGFLPGTAKLSSCGQRLRQLGAEPFLDAPESESADGQQRDDERREPHGEVWSGFVLVWRLSVVRVVRSLGIGDRDVEVIAELRLAARTLGGDAAGS